MKTLRFILKYFFLFYIGGFTYCGIEILYRGRTHWSMFLCAGIIFIYASVQNEFFEWDYPFWKQLLKVWTFALIAEFITGCIVNLWLECLGLLQSQISPAWPDVPYFRPALSPNLCLCHRVR